MESFSAIGLKQDIASFREQSKKRWQARDHHCQTLRRAFGPTLFTCRPSPKCSKKKEKNVDFKKMSRKTLTEFKHSSKVTYCTTKTIKKKVFKYINYTFLFH